MRPAPLINKGRAFVKIQSIINNAINDVYNLWNNLSCTGLLVTQCTVKAKKVAKRLATTWALHGYKHNKAIHMAITTIHQNRELNKSNNLGKQWELNIKQYSQIAL